MIFACIYFLLFCFLVSRLSFFKDTHLSFKFILAIILIKVSGCFIYYWFYFVYSPGNINGDSSDTLAGAETIYKSFSHNKLDFFKMIFGFHSNLNSDPLYKPYFKHIADWGDSDSTSEFFLNDNRTSVRFHALIRLFSLGHYAVHALAMLIISFTGQLAFYKAFKNYFQGKEKLLAAVIFITPSVLFWSSGILKEPIAISLLGMFLYCFLKLFIHYSFKIKYVITLLLCSLIFIVLKPYILVISSVPLLLFAMVNHFKIKRIFIFYILSLLVFYTGSVTALKFIFHKDVINTIVVRQNDFISLSKGGIFFVNGKNYLRLEYKDSSQYKLLDPTTQLCRLKTHARLMYWELDHLRDTIFVSNNTDTSLYKRLLVCKPAGSGIDMQRLQYSFSSFEKLLPVSFFNVLCKPFFYDARSVSELVASLENLGFLLFLIGCFVFKTKFPVNKNLLFLCISITLLSFLLIGITTTVTGAIVRYKVPFIPFLLMIPLLYLDPAVLNKIPDIKRFFNNKS